MNKPLKIIILLFLSFALVVLIRSNTIISNPIFQGKIMGTTYNVKITNDINSFQYKKINAKILKKLNYINQSMSTWIDDSEITKFNNLTNTNKFFISSDFYNVLKESIYLSEISNGYYDFTIQSILDSWGFGSNINNEKLQPIPDSKKIKKLLINTGWKKLILKNGGLPYIKKSNPNIKINLGGIAKGYAADELSHLLTSMGYSNYFIDIGGDVIARGVNQKKEIWKIGIRSPKANLTALDDIHSKISLSNTALATSGHYFNYRQYKQKIYSHILNPMTGDSLIGEIISVSILADNCIQADGLATAIFVMDVRDGLDLINSLDWAEGMIIIQNKNGILSEYFSKDFIKKTNYEKISNS